MEFTKIIFFLYAPQLSKFKNEIFIEFDQRSLPTGKLKQRLDLNEDIFSVSYSTYWSLNTQVKYKYILKYEMGETEKISIFLKRYIIKTNEENSIMIFDTPEYFIKEVMKQKILRQKANCNPFLIFIQRQSSSQEIEGLQQFITKSYSENKEELLESILDRCRKLQNESFEDFDLDITGIKQANKFLRQSKTGNIEYSYVKKLDEELNQEEIENLLELKDYKDRSDEIKKEELIQPKDSSLSLLFDSYINDKNQSNPLSLGQVEQAINSAQKVSLESLIGKIKEMQEQVISNRQEQELNDHIIIVFWTKLISTQLNDELLLFLIIHSSSLRNAFKGDMRPLLNHILSALQILKINKYFIYFIQEIHIFLKLVEGNEDILKQCFDKKSFQKLGQNKQLILMISLIENGILPIFDITTWFKKISLTIQRIDVYTRLYQLLIKINPFLQIYESIADAFSSLLKRDINCEQNKYNEYKDQLISLLREQWILQSINCNIEETDDQQINKNLLLNSKGFNDQNTLTKNNSWHQFQVNQGSVTPTRQNKYQKVDSSCQKNIQSEKISIYIKERPKQQQLEGEQLINEKVIEDVFKEMETVLKTKLLEQYLYGVSKCLDKLNLANEKECINQFQELSLKQGYDIQQFFYFYDLVYQKYSDCNQIEDEKGKVLFNTIFAQFEKQGIARYLKFKEKEGHFSDEFTYLFLKVGTNHNKQFQDIVLKDLLEQIKGFSRLTISGFQRFLNDQNLEKIYDYFQKNFNQTYSEFISTFINQISKYQALRESLIKLFQKMKPYLLVEYGQFENICIKDVPLNQIDTIYNQFKHLLPLFEFQDIISENIIFQKLMLITQDALIAQDGSQNKSIFTSQNLTRVFISVKFNLQKFIIIITQDEQNNKNLLEKYNFSSNNLKEKGRGNNRDQKQIDDQKLQIDLFQDNTITIKQLRELCGNNYEQSIRAIHHLLYSLNATYFSQELENLIYNVYFTHLLFSQGKTILNLYNLYQIDVNEENSKNKHFYNFLTKMIQFEQFENFPIFDCKYYFYLEEVEIIQVLKDLLPNSAQFKIMENVEVILNYIQNNLKLQSFLDLRELVSEDNTEVISLLMKLNSYKNVFQLFLHFKMESDKSFFIEKIIQFINKNISQPQIVVDLEECINNFHKIQNLSCVFDKNKRFISLICDILVGGSFIIYFDQATRVVAIKINCKKDYNEQEMRQVCSKIILEQMATTSVLIAAAQANVSKNNSFKEKSFQEGEELQNEQDELEQQIQQLKQKIQYFRDQWFLAEQLKDILQELIEYGSFSTLDQDLRYNNRNGMFQFNYHQMNSDLQQFKLDLLNWKLNLEQIYANYPYFTIIGFSHFKQLLQLFSRKSLNISQDLADLLCFLGFQKDQIETFLKQNQNFFNLSDSQKLTQVAKEVTVNKAKSTNRSYNLQVAMSKDRTILQGIYKGSSELLEILMNKINNQSYNVNFFEYFYYDNHSKIQDLELFLFRFQYLIANSQGCQFFIIFHKKLNQNFFIKAIELIQKVNTIYGKLKNQLIILINELANTERIGILPYISSNQIIQQIKLSFKSPVYPIDSQIDDDRTQISNKIMNSTNRIEFIYSDYPGQGKSYFIQQQEEIKNKFQESSQLRFEMPLNTQQARQNGLTRQNTLKQIPITRQSLQNQQQTSQLTSPQSFDNKHRRLKINNEDYNQEIDIQYKTGLNFSQSITSLKNSPFQQNMTSEIKYQAFRTQTTFNHQVLKQQLFLDSKISRITIPINTHGGQSSIIELFRKKLSGKLKEKKTIIHLDLYDMEYIDYNYLLFEIIFLKSLSVHSNKFIQLNDSSIIYYIEVQNSINQQFLNTLTIQKYFKSTKISFNIKKFQINNKNLSQTENINQFNCYKYLKALSKSFEDNYNHIDNNNELSEQVYSDNFISDRQYNEEFQQILDNLFIKRMIPQQFQPCYYQLKHFINLFGSEMTKFDNSFYLQNQFLNKNFTNQGIRYIIVNMSLQLCQAVSINPFNRDKGIRMQFDQSSKEQLLHWKAEQIKKFHNHQMNFVTFQEQENPCLTSFFDKQNNIPNCIKQLYDEQQESLLCFEQQNTPKNLLKWLIRLINRNADFMYKDVNSIEYEELKNQQLKQTVQRITIQKDNFFKIAMIFMRIRSNTPVIIMGQSGIGKTALIELLSLLMEAKFKTMTVNAGITEQDVINLISSCKTEYQSNDKIIIFFDEVNTNKHIGGIFKEIIVDRCLQGERLPPNLIPIAAINPYKLKSQKQKEMLDIQIHGGIKKDFVERIKSTDLEYMVEPIPESMYSFIWNFDCLQKQDENNYILQMVLIKNEIKMQKRPIHQQNQFSESDLQYISSALTFSQDRIREEMGYQSACSLRDVKRFLKLLFWFVKKLKIFMSNGLKIQRIQTYSICLAFYINYCIRLPQYEKRNKYLKDIARKFRMESKQFETIINESLTFLIDQTEIPSGIVKNSALKQNIFTLFVSIMNKIPVILIGPPGSSKSLSLSILIKSMKGEQSKSSFFKQFKAIIPTFYQGHIQSTSDRIQEVFEKANEQQIRINTQNQNKKYLSLMQIEEIGLAEISPNNPLKVLHSTLENPTIAVACISNWPLDQSKMNRMLAVYRLNSNKEELKEIISCIQNQMIENIKDEYLKNRIMRNTFRDSELEEISSLYIIYLSLLKQRSPQYEQFHGLRDFYGLVKLICSLSFNSSTFSQESNEIVDLISNQITFIEKVMISFFRHFSGLKQSRQILMESIEKIYIKHSKSFLATLTSNIPSNLKLIDDNLSESSQYYISRHLMIITEKPTAASEYISRKLNIFKRPYRLLMGSDFKEDQSIKNSYSIINQIISCVEAGIVVVLQNLDNIYQSLYELLNQNYREINGKPYCKISFGADSNIIEVGQGFRLILITHHSQIHRMDGPLLNRFEKHLFEENMVKNKEDEMRFSRVIQYLNSPELFNFQNIQEVLESLVMQQVMLYPNEVRDEDIIQQMYHLSTLSSSLKYSNNEQRLFKQEYINSQIHFSLEQFIHWKIIKNLGKKIKFDKLITIFSPQQYISQQSKYIYADILLSEIDSQQQLQDKILKFFSIQKIHSSSKEFDKGNTEELQPKIVSLVADLRYDSFERLALVRQKIFETFTLMEKSIPADIFSNYFFIMIIKTKDIYNLLPFSGIWQSYYLEDLDPLNYILNEEIRYDFSVQRLTQYSSESLMTMVDFKMTLKYFLSIKENMSITYRNITYKKINRDNYQISRLVYLWDIFDVENKILQPFISLCIQLASSLMAQILQSQNINTVQEFIEKYIFQKQFDKQTQSVASAIWNGFSNLMQQSFCQIIYVLEKQNLIYPLSFHKSFEDIQEVIIQQMLISFELDSNQFDFNQQVYQGNIIYKNQFIDFKRLELDESNTDFQFYQSSRINSLVKGILNKADNFSKVIVINEQQNDFKSNNFKQMCCQIDNTLQELLSNFELSLLEKYKHYFLNDLYQYFRLNITEFQRKVIQMMISSHHYDFKEVQRERDFIYKEIVFSYHYSLDLQKIEQIFTVFSWVMKECDIFFENTNGMRDYLVQLVLIIRNKIEPSGELLKLVNLNNVDLKDCIEQLISFINTYQLQLGNEQLTSVQQYLILYHQFLNFLINDLALGLKILNNVDLQQLKQLNYHYLERLKDQLKHQFEQTLLLQQSDQESNELSNEEKRTDIELDFDNQWNNFIIELLLNSVVQIERDQFSSQFFTNLLLLMNQIENSYIQKELKIPQSTIFRFKQILCEYTKIINKDKLIEIFNNEFKQPLFNQKTTTEDIYLVLLSSSLQDNPIMLVIDDINHKNEMISLLFQKKPLDKLSTLQKLIYLAIFRQVVCQVIKQVNQNLNKNGINTTLKQYFENITDKCLQIYIIKSLFKYYKEETIINQKVCLSPYLKDIKWIQKYTTGFKDLYQTQFLNNEQKIVYEKLLKKNKNDIKQVLQEYIQNQIMKSKNVFLEIYQGKIEETRFYPFTMNNNIHLFESNPEFTQLYQCKRCKEYTFSDQCPNLQSKGPCQLCGALMAKDNENTIQVLTQVKNNQNKLQLIKLNDQWSGFFIRLQQNNQDNKLDQGTALDLRIFTILYYLTFLLAYNKNNQYQGKVQMAVFNSKQNKEVSITRQKINTILRLHFEANPIEQMNEQIDIAIQHLKEILKQKNFTQAEIPFVLFRIINDLLADRSITSLNNIIDRVNLNNQLTQKISNILEQSTQFLQENNIQISMILESDNPDKNSIDGYYLRNLRATDLNFTQNTLYSCMLQNMNNNSYQILKELLDLGNISYINETVSVLISFTQLMNSRFKNRFTKRELQDTTLLKALEYNQEDPLYIYYINFIIPSWKKVILNSINQIINGFFFIVQIKEVEIQFQNGCATTQIQLVNDNTKMSNLVLADNKEYGYFLNILELILNKHNRFIQRIHSLCSMDSSQQFEKLIKFLNNTLCDQIKEVEKERILKQIVIENIDIERNIIKSYHPSILSSYIMSNVEYSKGFQYLYDFESLQEQLAKKVLEGVAIIDLEHSQKFQFLSEIHQIGFLSNNLISQEKLPISLAENLKNQFQSNLQIFELLQQVSTVFQYFKQEKSQVDLSIKSALDQLQINLKTNLFDWLLTQLKLKHLNDLISLLEELNMDNLIKFCNPQYQQPLEQIEFEKILSFLKETVTLPNFRIALGRFIIRCLSQEQASINNSRNLFEQLFNIDIYEELWDDTFQVEDSYSLACEYQITIGQSCDLFNKINNRIQFENDQQAYLLYSKENHNKLSLYEQNSMLMDQFSDNNSSKNIKDQFK